VNSFENLFVDNPLFSGEVIDEICVLAFKDMPLLHTSDLEAKEVLLNYLKLLSGYDKIKVLLLKSATVKMERLEYIEFYRKKTAPDASRGSFERMVNAINQFIVELAGLNKMVIYVDKGNVILVHMNIGLVCDYRIVADNTVYQNPNYDLGVMPTGGSIFLLSKRLGIANTSKILFSGQDITPTQAQKLGIVDEVVPLVDLDRLAFETAQSYARLPYSYSVGIKKLLNFDHMNFSIFLEYENRLFRQLNRIC
jgi:2-(1,2-epoxy-1,2-dihydrophenyl)acetyl-CoA isomerase